VCTRRSLAGERESGLPGTQAERRIELVDARPESRCAVDPRVASGAVRRGDHRGSHATPTAAATASRMTAATAAGWEMKTACEAPWTSVTVIPARS
jgi:hypothetical protein